MRLTPRDVEKLMLHTACCVAQKRYARGLRLNYPEAIALLSGQLLEFMRDGHALSALTEMGMHILGRDDVLPGVAEMIDEVQVEGTLVDGTKLVSVHQPIRHQKVDTDYALYGSGLTKAAQKLPADPTQQLVPGQVEVQEGVLALNTGRTKITMVVENTGSRTIQVGSHCAFAETNKALEFDRLLAVGYRLNIPAGTAIRFEPGELKRVELVEVAGDQKIFGGNNLTQGEYSVRMQEIEREMQEKMFIVK